MAIDTRAVPSTPEELVNATEQRPYRPLTLQERYHLRSLEDAGLVERYVVGEHLRWRTIPRPDDITPEDWATVGTFRPIAAIND
jgi:hypothetical protein